MATLVTTTSRKRKQSTKIPLYLLIAIVVLALIFFVLKPKKSTPSASPVITESTEMSKVSGQAAEGAKVSADVPQKNESKKWNSATAIPDADATQFADDTLDKMNEDAADARYSDGTNSVAAPKQVAHRVMPQRRKFFDNPVENQLERLAIPGRAIRATPQLSKLSQEEILEYLRKPIQINEDDDEETIAAKERTAALKTEALKYIAEGGNYDDFVREMVKVSNEEADMISDTRSEMMRIYKEEGATAAIEYLNEANAILKERGLKEIPVSSGLRKRAEEEQAALAQ